MLKIDERVVRSLQWIYDQLLDRLETRIGTFRMTIALTPVAAETAARILGGATLFYLLPDMLFLLGVNIFYTLRMMKCDDRLQKRHKLVIINTQSLRFRSKHVGLRMVYLFFFSSSLIFHHSVGGLGLLAIVYARCLTVRDRKKLAKRSTPAFAATRQPAR